jgi:hypothetical protein
MKTNYTAKIASVATITKKVEEGLVATKQIVLTCGCVKRPNPIYTYTVGEYYRHDCPAIS